VLHTFDDLVSACLEKGDNFRLLYVYMNMTEAPPEATLRELFPETDTSDIKNISSILFDAHEPIKPGLTFESMVKKADEYCPDWDVVFVQAASNMDGSIVSDEQANEFLADMRNKIMTGKFPANGPIFDRNGHLKAIDKAQPLSVHQAGEKIN